jgi:hypothetical protein
VEKKMTITNVNLKALLLVTTALISFPVAADPEQESESEPPPWYAVQAIAGIKTTGECVETMSALQVVDAVKFGLARIVSEKKAGGKVTQLTFSYQGVQGTIYRDRAACEVVARAAHKKQNATSNKYK